MTQRDEFAMAALPITPQGGTPHEKALYAYAIADAMMDVKNAPPPHMVANVSVTHSVRPVDGR